MATRVYVGEIHPHTTKEDLEGIFIGMGRLRDVWVAHNPPGFAFVDFLDPDDAARACRKLNGSIICGSRAVVQIAKKQHQDKFKDNGFGMGPPFEGRSQRPFPLNRRRSSVSPPPQGVYNQGRGPTGPRRSPQRPQPLSPDRRRRDRSSSRSPARSRRMSASPPPSHRYPPMQQSSQHPQLPAGYDYEKIYEIYARAARDELERFRQEYESRLRRKSRSRSPRSPPPRRQGSPDRRQGEAAYRHDSPAKRGRPSPSLRPAHSLRESTNQRVGRRQPSPLSPSSAQNSRYSGRRDASPDDRQRSRSRSPRMSAMQRSSQRVPGQPGRPRSPATAGRPRSPPMTRRPASPPSSSSARRPQSPPAGSGRARSPGTVRSPRGRRSPSGSRPPPASRRSRSGSRRSRSLSLPKAYRSVPQVVKGQQAVSGQDLQKCSQSSDISLETDAVVPSQFSPLGCAAQHVHSEMTVQDGSPLDMSGLHPNFVL